MPRMAAVVRVEFELKQGLAEDTATTALAGGTGALKLGIERGITRNRSDRRGAGFGPGQYHRADCHLIVREEGRAAKRASVRATRCTRKAMSIGLGANRPERGNGPGI